MFALERNIPFRNILIERENIMAQFASIRAVKTDTPFADGETISVKLKDGSSKAITLASLLYVQPDKHGNQQYFYLPAKS